MPKLDAFSAQLVALVRQMPDEAILALVKDHLGADDAGPAGAGTSAPRRGPGRRSSRRPATAKPAARKARMAAKRAGGATQRAGRAELVQAVEKFVLASKGVGLADVAKATGASKDRAKAALKELKTAKRIAHAGDRKFTRYAATTKVALAASKTARAGK